MDLSALLPYIQHLPDCDAEAWEGRKSRGQQPSYARPVCTCSLDAVLAQLGLSEDQQFEATHPPVLRKEPLEQRLQGEMERRERDDPDYAGDTLTFGRGHKKDPRLIASQQFWMKGFAREVIGEPTPTVAVVNDPPVLDVPVVEGEVVEGDDDKDR